MMTDILVPVLIIALLGLLLGLVLAVASKKFAVETDPRMDAVRDALPGANCGACGFSGCDAYAEAIIDGSDINKCPVGGEDTVEEIAKIMGVEAVSTEKMVARVMCQGNWDNAVIKYDYDGIIDCRSAAALSAGPNACVYGCVGMGSCAKICPFGAITVHNGLAHVDESKCTACQQCISECPKHIIELVPVSKRHSVLCHNHEKGGIARKNCKTACIGCQKCVKTCPVEAIKMDNLVAHIDPEICVNCGKCAEACPTGAILCV